MPERLAGLIRLTHPFPSLLDGAVVGGVALLAGATGTEALRLAASMTALQAAIGAVNDVVDAERDAGLKPGKPIPRGSVSRRAAVGLAGSAAVSGLVLAAPSGAGLVGLALVVLAIGLAYDLAAKGTAWSWVPFAVGIPILPLYGWWGATGAVPSWLVPIVAAAIPAGAALAIANARADLERDRAAGSASVATHLGLAASWWLAAGLIAAALAVAGLALLDAPAVVPGYRPGVGLVLLGGSVTVAGLGMGRRSSPAARERAWQVQALGAALVGLGWVAAVAT